METALPYASNLEILGKHIQRLRLLESLNRQFPQNTQVKRLLAETYAGSGNSRQALSIYDSMIEKDSLDPETYYEKAMVLEQLKDTTRAIKALQKAYSFRGWILMDSNSLTFMPNKKTHGRWRFVILF